MFLAHHAHDGSTDMGAVPNWYIEVQAAKYAACTPVEWAGLPWYHRSRVLAAMEAEGDARTELKRYHDAGGT